MDPPTQIPNLLLPDLVQNGKTEPNILIFWNICTSAIRLLRPTGVEPVTLIEAIADDRANNPLLPLRVHKFMRAVSGLWSCLNPSCTGERPTEWPFGALAFERAERCGHCHAPLFEISDCRDCGEPYLGAFDRGGLLAPAATAPDLDEFAAASEREDETSLGEDEEGSASVASAMTPGRLRLIATRAIPRMTEIAVYPATGALPDRRDAGAHISITSLSWDGSCPACHAAQRVGEEGPIRPFRFGAPFLIAAAPVFLDSVRPMDQSEGLLPGEGRRLLSSTDSRQGTARFAANIETNSERAYVRGYLYHLVQKSATIEIVDRKAALACVERLLEGMRAPQADDAALPEARLSPPAADAIVRLLARRDRLTLFANEPFDLAALSNDPFISLFAAARVRGADVRLGLERALLEGLNTAQRLGLRDAAVRHSFSLWFAQCPVPPNGSALIATLESGAAITGWCSRDRVAATIGAGWGSGQTAPIVQGAMSAGIEFAPIDPTLLLPKTGAGVRVIAADQGRSLRLFGNWFAHLVQEELEALGLWGIGALAEIRYSDRYLRSPLSVVLTLRALAGLRDALAGKHAKIPLSLLSSPLDARNDQTPYLSFHDWQNSADREAVIQRLAQSFGFDAVIDLTGTQHAREPRIGYRDGRAVRIYLDQGFAYWRVASRERFDFSASPGRQAKQLEDAAPLIVGNGNTYFVVTRVP
jgi:hypothetical protein